MSKLFDIKDCLMIEKTVPPSVTTEDTNGSSVAAGSPAASKKGKKDKKDDKMPNSMNCKLSTET